MGHIETTIPVLAKSWQLSVDIKPYQAATAWENVLHATTLGNEGTYGYRTPAVFLTRDDFIVSDVLSDDNKHMFRLGYSLPLNQYTNVLLTQKRSTTGYAFTISINGTEVYNVLNPLPTDLPNVKVYVTSQWYNSARAYIKMLSFINTEVPQLK